MTARNSFSVGDPAPRALRPCSESDITSKWMGDKPVVSILCATYQHVEYIEDAINGFLAQETVFPFEVIVRDDSSTDGTAEIVRDYADRYPNIIRPILETTNRWPAIRPSDVMLPRAQGDFVAYCEGDDYWISPKKLARQVDALDARTDAAASHHDAVVINGDRIVASHELPSTARKSLSARQLLIMGFLPVRVLCVRNPLHRVLRTTGVNGDIRLTVSIGLNGGSVYVDEGPFAVYRRHAASWRSENIVRRSRTDRFMDIAASRVDLARVLVNEGELRAARYWQRRAILATLRANSSAMQSLSAIPLAVAESAMRELRSRRTDID